MFSLSPSKLLVLLLSLTLTSSFTLPAPLAPSTRLHGKICAPDATVTTRRAAIAGVGATAAFLALSKVSPAGAATTESVVDRISREAAEANAKERDAAAAKAEKAGSGGGGGFGVVGVLGGGLALSLPFFLPNLIRAKDKLGGGRGGR